jgi:hypothetical protein
MEDGRAADEQMRASITKLNELKAELQRCHDNLSELKVSGDWTNSSQCSLRLTILQRQGEQMHRRMLDAKRIRDALLAEHNEDVPVNIQALEEAKEVFNLRFPNAN